MKPVITGYPLAALTSNGWFGYHRLFRKSMGIKPVTTGYHPDTPDFFNSVFTLEYPGDAASLPGRGSSGAGEGRWLINT